MPEWIASDSVDGSSMTIVVFQVLVCVIGRAFVDGAVLCRNIVAQTVLSLGEIDTETTSVDESHTSFLLLLICRGTTEHIFLVRIGLSLELGQDGALKTTLHVPVEDVGISRDSHKGFTLSFSVNPLQLPDNIGVLSIIVLA